MGRELDPNFSKLSNSLGNPARPPSSCPPCPPPPLGENIVQCIQTKKVVVLSFLWKVQWKLSDQTERMPTLIWVFAGRLWSFHLFLFCWGPYKNVYATFMHGTHLTYNAPAGTWASWSFLHRECAIEKKPSDCLMVRRWWWWWLLWWWWCRVVALVVELRSMRDITIISNKQLNKTVSGVFKHWMLYRISKGSPFRLFSICISNRSPSCFLKRRASAKGGSDRESAMNNQRVKWQKWFSTELADSGPVNLGTRDGGSWTPRHAVNYNSHKGC